MDLKEELEIWPCHLPPDDFKPEYILDLGANIGITIVDFKKRWPYSKIIGVELDRENFDQAILNVSTLTKINLLHGAVTNWNGTCSYKKVNSLSHQVTGIGGEIPCYTIDSIVALYSLPRIDYIKMDIEGSEEDILKNTNAAWPQITKCINVEVHGEYLPETCKKDLKRLGFDVEIKKYTSEWNTWFHLIGINNGTIK